VVPTPYVPSNTAIASKLTPTSTEAAGTATKKAGGKSRLSNKSQTMNNKSSPNPILYGNFFMPKYILGITTTLNSTIPGITIPKI
jgi:hypothetical protein